MKMKKKGYAMGGMKKGYAMGGMKKKMKAGGGVKKFQEGGPTQEGTRDRRISQFMDDDSANYLKFKERGTSGAAEGDKQAKKIMQKAAADVKNIELYGKDAPKGRSFGQKTQPKQGEIKTPVETIRPQPRPASMKKKGGSIKKMKAGGMTKKMKAGGGVAKKGKAKGGKSKVRGAGIAQRGVRPAQMR